MNKIYLTNAQFGYIHLYACALHALPEPTIELPNQDCAPAGREARPASKASAGLLERLAERLFLSFLLGKS
jgi:hypothetical protein